jgi:hypothetical protein
MIRISNQKSAYSTKRSSKSKFDDGKEKPKIKLNLFSSESQHKRLNSIEWRRSNKENLIEIDKKISARDK